MGGTEQDSGLAARRSEEIDLATTASVSAAGQIAFGIGANPIGQEETADEKRRRLQAPQASQSGIAARLSQGYSSATGLSPAGIMAGLGGSA